MKLAVAPVTSTAPHALVQHDPDAGDGRDPAETVAQASAVFAAGLGPGYLTRRQLEQMVSRPRQQLLVARAGGVVVGAATAVLLDRDALDRLARAFDDPVWPHRDGIALPDLTGPYGLLQSVAVLPGFRQQGIAGQLTAARIRWFVAVGASGWAALARHPARRSVRPSRRAAPDRSTARGTLLRAGLEPVASAAHYWRRDRTIACPSCTHGCGCTAELMAATAPPSP